MKKLICMIPTSGKTMEQIKAEAIGAFRAAGVFGGEKDEKKDNKYPPGIIKYGDSRLEKEARNLEIYRKKHANDNQNEENIRV